MAPQDEVTPYWVNYIDLDQDLKPYMQFPPGPNDQDANLEECLSAACEWAQDTLGQPIAPTQFFRRYSGGTGPYQAYIQLPFTPVLSVSTVTEYRAGIGYTITEQVPASQGGQDVFQLDAINGVLIRTFVGLVPKPWFPGERNIEVTWTAGYNPVPRRWIMATKELAKYWWTNTQQSSRSFSRANQEEYANPMDRYALWPAVPDRIAAMFQKAQRVGMG